ncbi:MULTISPECIES: hypothetical protein [Streptomyces]|uniref:Uncharacterized protein n=1 Tax=Streptomyces tsukubensis (strain DSM 42081 / NBRC 108919 / NRRL 18488 / 9993) TaxID=1114943 RepID=I2N7W1_STRT9|nr:MULTISPECIES: hypothetical protein [Streptomyces]AZK97054.1 hypothetical protein B7R87_26670 [Streptomyces tsukubensis]EIF93108.1 hypothetical protein [Streptomyces tsukubensis NRRL18488]MYS66504.1 hypothetical protein [Streptomyces sp. SID5473]QKM66973.1 hypothetical protein STSU_007110 [Streptomyces tsukubensis NRRL18488]TAI41550.1 hypothetical protein EWI31_27340 [Streptomyces tsukubensis]
MNRSRTPVLHRHTGHWSPRRRITAVAVAITVLVALAALVAWTTGDQDQHRDTTPAAPASSTPATKDHPGSAPASGTGSVAAPPRLDDPLAYARAAAGMLWSYDTRTTGRDQQLAGMRGWMSPETKYTDWPGIRSQVPDPVLWSRMRDNAQHATATVSTAKFPSAFKQALAEDPAALTEAYIYAVTVTGKQTIGWKDGGGGAEDRAVTLAVQCRPSTYCGLVSIAPRVAP